MVCKKCGKEFEGVFCPYCGERNATELPPECPVCSTPRKDQEKFCSNCGYSYYGVNLARLKREEMAKNAKTNAQNAVTFVKKHRTAFIAAAVLLVLVLIVVIPTTVWAANIFRTGKVDQISIGMSQKEVIDKLGMPYDYSPNSSGFSYYSDNYLKLKEKLDSLDLEDIESFEELEDAIINEEKYREELENTVYDYIYIGFDGDGLVDSVFFDNEKCDKDTDVKKRVKDSELIPGSVVRYQETPVYYRVEYTDGSLYKGLVENVTAMDNSSYSLEWTDRYGNDFQDRVEVTPNPEIVSVGEYFEDIMYTVSCDDVMTIFGSGYDTIPGWYVFLEKYNPWEEYDIAKLVIQEGITAIDAFAFFMFFDMTEVVINSGVTSIGDSAFEGCTSLTTITIPGTVTELGDGVFAGCPSLEKIIFNGTIEQWEALESSSSGNDKLVVECTDGRCRFFVTYDLDGGVNAASNPTSYTMGTLGGADGSIALADPSKKGEILGYTSNGDGSFEVTQNVYTFLGWYKDPSFKQKVTSLTLDLGDVTLYAKWSEQPTEVQTETKQYVRVNKNDEGDAQGEYILFGCYPQTIKSSDVTVGDVADEDGYYLGSDGERYAKVVAYPHESGYTFSDGSDVTNGETYYFKVEPIRWRILSESDGSAFILADGIIANHYYHHTTSSTTIDGEKVYANNYKHSDIRAWLNGEFLDTAFVEVAQSLIETTEVDNSVYSTGYSGNPYACENTFDKVFLLSYREAVNSDYGFSSDTARMTVSDYARSTGAYMDISNDYFGCGNWWLRSPYYYDSSNARLVYFYGDAYVDADSNLNVDYDDYGVVPAMNIKL